jgi:hypothetical protein
MKLDVLFSFISSNVIVVNKVNNQINNSPPVFSYRSALFCYRTEPHRTIQKTTKACPKGHKKTPKSKEIGVFSFFQSLIVIISMRIFLEKMLVDNPKL